MKLLEILIFIGLLVSLFAFLEIGRVTSLRAVKNGSKSKSSTSGPVEAIVFGLLGLLIAFTFSGAESRFEYRRQLIIDAANTISTVYSRIDLLSNSSQPEMRRLLKRYTEVRAHIYQEQENLSAGKNKLLQESNTLQKQLWALAVSDCYKSANRSCEMLLLPALNDAFGIATVRQAAQQSHPPLVIYILLIVIALFGALLVGYNLPTVTQRNMFYMLIYSITIAVLITLIIDLELPRTGFVRLDSTDQLILDLSKEM